MKNRLLRFGYTTGTCATAAVLAAAHTLLDGNETKQVEVTLPRGQKRSFTLSYCYKASSSTAAIIKDAGDDPDVTHGALIIAKVILNKNNVPFIRLFAGHGVGTVTLPGLPLHVGEPAINPIPRKMIEDHLVRLSSTYNYQGGFTITIEIANGDILARQTLNPRLGILGGLSILGTTGIVRPFSCSAYITTIQQAIDIAHANGIRHIAVCTGAASEAMIINYYKLPLIAVISMGDFVGVVLKHLRKILIPKLSLVGGFGKISKLAMGYTNLHSSVTHINLDMLAQTIASLGGTTALQKEILSANTSSLALSIAQSAELPLGNKICEIARDTVRCLLPHQVAIEVWAVNRDGHPVGHAGFT